MLYISVVYRSNNKNPTNLAITGTVVEFTGQPSIKAVSTLSIRRYITFIALGKCCNKLSLEDKRVVTTKLNSIVVLHFQEGLPYSCPFP
jgi:hypothetical protein